MTTKELSQLYWLNLEIKQDRARLRDLEEEITKIKVTPDNGIKKKRKSSRVENIAILICEQKELIKTRLEALCREQNRLQEFIDSIDSSLIRQIFQLRYGMGYMWKEVAAQIGTRNENTLRRLHKKYLIAENERK